MRRLGFVLLLAVSTLTVGLLPQAAGDTHRYGDQNDVRGPLDIKWVSHGHSGSKLEHKIATFEGWQPEDLRRSSFGININVRSDDPPEQEGQPIDHCINGSIGKLKAEMVDCESDLNGPRIGPVKVLHPKPKLLILRFPDGYLKDSGPYQWGVQLVVYDEPCKPDRCVDFAPGDSPIDLIGEHPR